MAYLKPQVFLRRLFNPLAMRFGIGGAVTLSVVGRRTGEARSVPVIPIEQDGVCYLVAAHGETEWVRNLRAAGTGELRTKGKTERFRATEISVGERAPIIATYRRVAGKTVTAYFAALPEPADHPVFRIESRGI